MVATQSRAIHVWPYFLFGITRKWWRTHTEQEKYYRYINWCTYVFGRAPYMYVTFSYMGTITHTIHTMMQLLPQIITLFSCPTPCHTVPYYQIQNRLLLEMAAIFPTPSGHPLPSNSPTTQTVACDNHLKNSSAIGDAKALSWWPYLANSTTGWCSQELVYYHDQACLEALGPLWEELIGCGQEHGWGQWGLLVSGTLG